MFQNRNVTLRIVLATAMSLGLVACSEKSRSPLSPYVAGPMEGVVISPPSPISPIGGLLIVAGDPVVLRFGSATSNSERPFWHEIQLASDSDFVEVLHQADQVESDSEGLSSLSEGTTTLDYSIPDSLDADRNYWWRARAVDGANVGSYSEAQTFEIYTPVVLGIPEPIAPDNGATLDELQPFLQAALPSVSGPAENLRLQFEVARDAGFTNRVALLTVSPDGADLTIATTGALSADTTYYWRVRALADGRVGEVVGQWSSGRSFKTPAPAPAPTPPPSGGGGGGGGFTPGGSPNAPFTTNGGNPPNMFHVVEQVAAEHPGALANSCPHEGGSWEFLDRVVEALRAIDGRWGYNCKRGDCGSLSVDVVDYYRGQGNPQHSSDVAIIDVIGKVCGPGGNPTPAWIDVTQETKDAGTIGRWIYPR